MLHTSDVHISGDELSIAGFRAVVDAAVEHDVDLLIIAGDFFDSSRVREDATSAALGELGRVGRPVVLIPGNHDCVDHRSIYHRVDPTSAGEHVFFAADPDGEELFFDHLSLAIWARGIESHDPAHQPLAGFKPAHPDHWRVVVTHGHYVPTGERSERSSRITQQEIGALECDYVALGHWHRYADVSEGDVKAFYCGSPSEPGSDGPTVNLVTLHPDDGVIVDRHPIRPRFLTPQAG
jgi:DNA repair exonuclease SbcCD nuclease subunit